jgi:hypothetical protein
MHVINILVFPAEAFKHSIEVVWLAYAIVAHIYASVLTSSNIKFTMKNNGNLSEVNVLADLEVSKIESKIPEQYLKILQHNEKVFHQVSFTKGTLKHPIQPSRISKEEQKKQHQKEIEEMRKKPREARKLVFSSPTKRAGATISLSSQTGIEMFEKFLNHSKKILRCDNSSLVCHSYNFLRN